MTPHTTNRTAAADTQGGMVGRCFRRKGRRHYARRRSAMMAPMEGQATAAPHSGGHLERFDPGAGSGRLIDAEHRGRYWWAAQVAPGRDVLDAACGTGYGSAILRTAGAKSVT